MVYNLFREGNDTPLQYSYLENPVDGGDGVLFHQVADELENGKLGDDRG